MASFLHTDLVTDIPSRSGLDAYVDRSLVLNVIQKTLEQSSDLGELPIRNSSYVNYCPLWGDVMAGDGRASKRFSISLYVALPRLK
jgi:hypothetical protein